jgi:hypothetical protein
MVETTSLVSKQLPKDDVFLVFDLIVFRSNEQDHRVIVRMLIC